MREFSLPDVIDRLRLNLRDAGIPVPEVDIAFAGERGFLNGVLAFEAAMRGSDASQWPDFLIPGEGEAAASSRPVSSSNAERVPSPKGFSASRLQDEGFGNLGIAEAARLLRTGDLSASELVEASIRRIEARNGLLHAFVADRFEKAREEARGLGRVGAGDPPLSGIPIAVKDIFDVEGMPTKAGTLILGKTPAETDSAAVAGARKAGAIVMGKTSLPEFSFSPGSNNDHFGPTHNPHDLERDSGGSSSGSAVAVADRMVLGALGSDSGGSIRIPASFCGIVGYKPAWGWSSLAGTAGLSWSLDTLGVLASTVEDAAILASVLEPTSASGRPSLAPASALRGDFDLRGLRIGVLRGEGKGKPLADQDVLAAWEGGLAVLRDAGALLLDLEIEELSLLRAINGAVLSMEAAVLHREIQTKHLAEYGEFTRLGLLAGWAYGPADYLRARQALGGLKRSMSARFASIDLLCSPTMTSEAPLLGRPPKITFTAPVNALGWPAISLPVGTGATGLPVGLQFVGMPGSESFLLGAASGLEARLG